MLLAYSEAVYRFLILRDTEHTKLQTQTITHSNISMSSITRERINAHLHLRLLPLVLDYILHYKERYSNEAQEKNVILLVKYTYI